MNSDKNGNLDTTIKQLTEGIYNLMKDIYKYLIFE